MKPLPRTNSRSCGPCSLCCKVMAVSAIPKGRGVWCPHASRTGEGCKVYDDRPNECRTWSCAWLDDHPAFLDCDRPDKVSIVGSVWFMDVHLSVDQHDAHESAAGVALRARIKASGFRAIGFDRRNSKTYVMPDVGPVV